MAQISKYFPLLKEFEGGFVDDPNDTGGATNMGITLATWKRLGYDKDQDGDIDVEDLKLITEDDFKKIVKIHFWDKWEADYIVNQSVANMLVDWYYNSGNYGIRIPQRLMGVEIDGVVGNQTLTAVNMQDPYEFFNQLKTERIKYLNRIVVKRPSANIYLNGWINRVNKITFSDET